MQDLEARIKAAVARIENRDQKLAEELNDVRASARTQNEARVLSERIATESAGLEGVASPRSDFAQETIVLRVGRPVLAVQRDEPSLIFKDAESEIWRDRLVRAREHLVRAIKAVGRVEVANHPQFQWVGTAWLLSENVIVTNRHVAVLFGDRSGSGFVFRQGRDGRPMATSIDFLEEIDRTESLDFRVKRILHIEKDRGPDIALLEVEPLQDRSLARPITLRTRGAERNQQIAVIGYPAKDSRIPDQQLMEDIFGNVYDKKRLAPGQITKAGRREIEHDCSTLGGNSGSALIDLETGEALGLHFAGRFLEANFAVPASVVADRLKSVGRIVSTGRTSKEGSDGRGSAIQATAQAPSSHSLNAVVSSGSVSYTIPIRITIDVGTPVADNAAAAVEDDDDEILRDTEARPEDYADREGYDPEFLGVEVPLPEIDSEDQGDVLTYEADGAAEHELRYQHFSVVMSRSRRLCRFSAVNIDGRQSRKSKRVGWRFDPRIPAKAQILKECYGNAPKFSRGHMTRREDPVWGGEEDAALGNEDSMHATNAVPQMQPFNAGIWLGLEDYALENAREDDMRISVFTGPFLREDDPVRFGVQVPVSFWKVIAFIHDETGELSATGYVMSQEAFLEEEEHVFGQHETAQVPIATIEEQTGLSFGDLADRDPLAGMAEEETVLGALTDFKQIRFVSR